MLIPVAASTALIFTCPTLFDVYWIVSALNVAAEPTLEYIDFISPIPYEVTEVETLVFSIPSNMSLSPMANLPEILPMYWLHSQ